MSIINANPVITANIQHSNRQWEGLVTFKGLFLKCKMVNYERTFLLYQTSNDYLYLYLPQKLAVTPSLYYYLILMRMLWCNAYTLT